MKLYIFNKTKFLKKVSPGILIVLLLTFTFVSNSFGQEMVRLEDKRISISMKDVAFGTVIGHLTRNYGLSFGVEVVPGYEESDDLRFAMSKPNYEIFIEKKTQFSLDLKDASLAEVMDSLMKQKPGYRWEISDGVINIFPTEARDERLRKLLELKIASFVMENERDLLVGKILDCIVDLPELKVFEKSYDLSIPRTHVGSIDALFIKMDKVQFKNLSLKQLLNKLALVKGGSWRLTLTASGDPSIKDRIWLEI